MPTVEPPREDLRADLEAIVKHADAFEADEANAVLERISAKVAGDRELAFATFLALAEAFRQIYDSGWTAKALRAALHVAPPDRWIAIAIEYVAALEGDSEGAQAEAMAAELFARVPAADTFDVRMRLASACAQEHASTAATRLLRAAAAEARDDEQRAHVLVELRTALRDNDEDNAAETAALAALLAQPAALSIDTQIRGHLELAAWHLSETPSAPDVILHHAALAAKLGTRGADAELRDRASERYAEALFDAGEYERAEAVAVTMTPKRDEYGRPLQYEGALLEHIRRKRGTLADPPESVFAELPPIDDDTTFRFAEERTGVPEELAKFFTPAEGAAAIANLVGVDRMHEWSHGRVRTPDDLESQKIFGPIKSYACRCGRFLGNTYRGIVCHKCGVEVISRTTRTYRPAHISLMKPVVHPWLVGAIAKLLRRSQPSVRKADPSVLADELEALDLYRDAATIELTLEDGFASETKRAELTERLAYLAAFRDGYAKPSWCILTAIPVWPPEAELPNNITRAALRTAYVDILEPPDLAQAVRRLFNLFAK